ncbi:MAG: hypothetical protein ABI199_03395 [Bacteroidia bacterium]
MGKITLLEFEKQSMWKRYSKILLSNTILYLFAYIFLLYFDGEGLSSFSSDGIAFGTVFLIYLYAIRITIRWNKIFVYQIYYDAEFITINYLSYNKEKKIIFNKRQVNIELERVPSVSLFQKFQLTFKQDNLSITQYSNTVFETDWNKNKIKELYENLVSVQKE